MTSIFLFLVIVLLVLLHPDPILIGFAIGEFIFRAVGIYFVSQFVGELEEENNLSSSSAQLCYYDPEIDPSEYEHDVQEFWVEMEPSRKKKGGYTFIKTCSYITPIPNWQK